MAMTLGRVSTFEEDVDEQLDFEDENFLEFPHTKGTENRVHQKRKDKRTGRSYRYDNSTSDLEASPHSVDEGELRSEEETDVSDDNSSEEGEVSSDLEEMELADESPPVKEETPWERGLRLARERLERAKLLKAAEKDLAEKRMNLEVPASAIDDELEKVVKEDVFWPCYYQALIIGRTELTGHRFLPEDLLPPTASEMAAWRKGFDSGRHGRRQRRRATSPSGSSSVSSSSRASSVASSSVSSTVSSLASVAASWKATCAKAMKDYLSSPLGAKGHRRDHHGGRRRRGQQSPSSVSSGSSSRSSDSRSVSNFSRDRARRATGYGHILTAATGAKLASQRVRRMWPEEPSRRRKGRQVGSGSNQSSSQSGGSRSASSQDSSDDDRRPRGWKYGQRRGRRKDKREHSDQRSSSQESDRERREVPPLPHERPVKRPWVAAPGLVTAQTTVAQTRHRSRSSSHSNSASPPPVDEKRFITSWSRSPSSGNERRGKRDPIRRERLPDVVPGSHRGVTPGRKKKVCSPFTHNHGPISIADQFSLEMNDQIPGFPAAQQPSGVSYTAPSSLPAASQPIASAVSTGSERPDAVSRVPPAAPRAVEQQQQTTDHDVATPSQTGGELPSASNRPGVRLTLAPRLKASAVGIASLTGAASRSSTNKSFQPSPPPQSRPPRLPLPPSLAEHNMSTGGSGSTGITVGTAPLTAEQIRIQAEAAAAIVEARERRRAAAEAARRHRNPNRRKHDDLSKIPIRGRPTYRRQSFSSSSSSSSSEGSSRSRSATGAAASSASRSRSTSPQTPDSRCDDPYGLSNRPDYQPPRGRRGTMRRGGAPSGYGREDFRDQTDDYYYSGNYGRSMQQGPPQQQQFQSRDFPVDGGRMRKRGDEYGRSDRGVATSAATHHRHKNTHETGDRHRVPYKSHMAHDYPGGDDVGDMYSAPPMRYQGDLKVAVSNRGRYSSVVHEDLSQQRYPAASRRMVSQTAGVPTLGERLARPRTPHADFDEPPPVDRRSPRLTTTTMDSRLRTIERSYNSHKDDRDIDSTLGAPSRKRACIVAPDSPEESAAPDPVARRARTRHRSRGPGGSGAPIDRSEPFESDAGSFAAEQRLRELRERLNLVDDAIAEIKAGSAR